MNRYEQRYGNRAVKARFVIEAETEGEARSKAANMLADEQSRGPLLEDVRLIGKPELVAVDVDESEPR